MNRIGIDVYSALHTPRGMGIYTINFLKELAKIDKETQYILYGDINDEDKVLPQQENFVFKKLNANGLFHYEQVVLPKQCKKDKINILHSPANTSPIFLERKIKRILSLHDVMFLKKEISFPNNKKQIIGRLYYILTSILNAKKANVLITPTEYSKQDIIKELKIKEDKIIVDTRGTEHFDISNVTSFEELKEKYNIPEHYFFHVGGDAPTKNTDKLLEVFASNVKYNIVVAGIKVLETSHLYKKFNQYKNIIFVPYISQTDIVGLYKNAAAFIVPSIYEGFGLPLLEAMKCDCPIICSNASCLPEVAGDCAIYFSPYDKNDIYDKIIKIQDKTTIDELKSHYKSRLEKYSWKRTAEETLKIYNYI